MATPNTPQRRHPPVRASIVLLLAGTALYVIPSAVHGNPPVDSAQDTLEYVRQRPSWRLVHMANILAVLLWAGAFTALAPVAAPASRTLGSWLRVLFTASAAVFAVYFSLHAFGLSTLADRYTAQGADPAAVLQQTEAVLTALGSTAFTAQAMLGASVALSGAVFSRSHLVPGWVGWCGAVAGTGWLVGALLVNFAVIVPFTALTWLWTVMLAVPLWRGATRETAPPASAVPSGSSGD
ncbi:uncharacterized protein DUF4386 [Haloactinospora alba]|uniref:Uncharacterized protein DUF4386 n=1 Tax=Haloactinospora alba TaxID=405555 RepID=A0A543NN63_9ACTN|nr:DUF4386 family protein [Haloactinospora alba]TQN33270.1 uncharacterized protein DUF4386 [Haloactinospora alba]